MKDVVPELTSSCSPGSPFLLLPVRGWNIIHEAVVWIPTGLMEWRNLIPLLALSLLLSPFFLPPFLFEVGFHYVAPTGLTLAILLPHLPTCWTYSCVPPCPTELRHPCFPPKKQANVDKERYSQTMELELSHFASYGGEHIPMKKKIRHGHSSHVRTSCHH